MPYFIYRRFLLVIKLIHYSITILGDNSGNIINKHSIFSVKQELRNAGISEEQIENIAPQISNIITELNKDKPDENKLEDIFTKVKKKGAIFW